MDRRDALRLQDMFDAASEAVSMSSGETRASLDQDRKLALALVKLIEIIGEAATNTSDEVREKFADIPWRSIVGMRNRLIHAYFNVDLDTVWDTVTKNLPPFIEALRPVLAQADLELGDGRTELFKKIRTDSE